MPTITMTQTTTRTSSSSLWFNTGYLKSIAGLLKIAQLVLGIICIGIVGHYINYGGLRSSELFFLLMATTFLIGTFCLLLACLISLSTGGLISKTIYELIYHSIAFVLYFIASVVLLVETLDGYFGSKELYDSYMAASIIGIINSILYLISIVFAQRAYHGI